MFTGEGQRLRFFGRRPGYRSLPRLVSDLSRVAIWVRSSARDASIAATLSPVAGRKSLRLRADLGHVPIRVTGEHPRGSGVPLDAAHPPGQVRDYRSSAISRPCRSSVIVAQPTFAEPCERGRRPLRFTVFR
ncbi:hypothetical protein [Nocardia sp. CY41]|uniref:hypothetical protein n=1 Tax=Nocardia sp. CY41 TaxID=2608686 RepID=UPI0019155DE2|nr:hypothetical protein [Nocardia sp. CY41]